MAVNLTGFTSERVTFGASYRTEFGRISSLDDIMANSEPGNFGNCRNPEFAFDLGAVIGHGLVAEGQAFGNFTGVQPLGQQAEDLEFPGGEVPGGSHHARPCVFLQAGFPAHCSW